MIDILSSTEPHFVPQWPAAFALDVAGGIHRLERVAELWIGSMSVAALSTCIGARRAALRGDKAARSRVLSLIERTAVCCCAPCFALLHAVQFSLVDYQHQYHCVLYSLFALALVGPESRLTPRLILVFLVHTYASAGVAKVLNSSTEWATGEAAHRTSFRRARQYSVSSG